MPTNIYKTISDYPTITSVLAPAVAQASKFVKDVGMYNDPANCWKFATNTNPNCLILMDTTNSRYRLISKIRLIVVPGIYGSMLLETNWNQPVDWNVMTEVMVGRKDMLNINYEIEKFKTETAYTFVQF